MKSLIRNLMAAITAICLAACTTEIKEVEVGPYTVSTIDNGVFHIQDYNSSNPAGETFDEEGNKTHFNNCSDIYLIVGKEKALLIDLSNNIKWADNAAESLRKIVSERAEGKELIITFTHNHGDHVGMIHAYADDKDVHFALPETDFQHLVTRFPVADYSFIDEGHVFDLGKFDRSGTYGRFGSVLPERKRHPFQWRCNRVRPWSLDLQHRRLHKICFCRTSPDRMARGPGEWRRYRKAPHFRRALLAERLASRTWRQRNGDAVSS